MKSTLGGLGAFCTGAAVGILAFRLIAVEGGWLYDEADYDQALKQQRITYYSDLCDALGEADWLASGKPLEDLQLPENDQVRSRFADATTDGMKIEMPIRGMVSARCARLLAVS